MKKTSLPTLFKYTSSGKVQQWTMNVSGNKFWSVEGLLGGKLTTNEPTLAVSKNVGRSNETTPKEQALIEASAKHQKKLDKGYSEKLTSTKKFFEPMLAQDLKKYSGHCFTVPTFIQPKLDGARCINADDKMMSRTGKEWVTCDHLSQDKFTLDGELYSHEYSDNFNKIMSLVKRTKPSESDIAECREAIEFWAYDFPDHGGVFSERYEALLLAIKKLKNPMIKAVPTFEVFSDGDIQQYHELFLSQGYEGSIIRLDLGPYENKRSKQLLKNKDFYDGEFEITGIEEGKGNRGGTAGRLTLLLPDGRTFGAGLKFNRDEVREILKNKKKYIGKTATIKYFQETPDGIPRFGVVTQIARETYE